MAEDVKVKKEAILLWLDVENKKILKLEAEKRGLTATALVRMLTMDYLAKCKSENKSS